jgi:hypothetical protein
LSRLRTSLAVLALAVPIPIAIGACGDEDDGVSDEDPQAVLEETFDNEEVASSGNLSMNASFSAEGEEGGSFEASLEGPFQGDPDDPAALPQLDLTASVNGDAGGESVDFEGGLVITEDNAYVEYQGDTYEIGTETFRELRDGLEAQAEAAGGDVAEVQSLSFREQCELGLEQAGAKDTSACDIDITSWLTNLTNEGTEDVGGAEAIHISGDANVDQILADAGELAGSVPDASVQGFDPSQLGTFSDLVSGASIDVFSGVDDRLLRGLDVNLAIDPSALGLPVPISNIDVSLSLEIADVNEEQTIEAPEGDVKPIEDLTGGIPIDAFGGLSGGGLPSPGGADANKITECLEQAGSDPQALEKCLS